MKKNTSLLFADDDLLIALKPAGVLSIPDRFDASKENLLDQLRQEWGEVLVVHRLDRETSGILCFARNEAAHRHLNQQFFDRSVDKYYLALVEGKPVPAEGSIDRPIAPHPTIPGKMMVAKQGKSALTHYRTLDTFRFCSLMEAEIKTGRTHQIRVHFSALGHPLVVDSVYGKRSGLFLSEIKNRGFNSGKDTEERPLLGRLSLHAARLILTHPSTGERMEFAGELPKDFRATLAQLEKWGR
ncbi:MAG: RluA family pseudouridine synthase [Lewinellaceae bacterium]|nr:RluA family pseudouridine synthase [Lewinellaceae bacterium]